MYSIDRSRLSNLRLRRRGSLSPNVYGLGCTSLLTDVSAEMAAAVLPVYLVLTLGFTPLQFGLIDGLYHGAAAVAAIAGGLLADRGNRHRAVAACGYALSALCKLALLGAGNGWGAVAATIALDRVGKGIRTAPRDALLSLSTQPAQLGLAFGVHRALDTAGALLGPVLAFAILFALPGAYDVVFVTSFFVAIAGLAVLLLMVRGVGPGTAAHAHRQPLGQVLRELARNRRYATLLGLGFVLALVAVPDAFIYLTVQQRSAMDTHLFPLLPVATALTFLLFTIPVGRLSDRIGRARVFVLGHLLLLAACAALLAPGAWTGLLALALLGLYYACTDGVVVAAASAWLPAHQRAAGIGALATAIGVARLLASVLFGAAWQHWSLSDAVLAFGVAQAFAILLAWRRIVRSTEGMP